MKILYFVNYFPPLTGAPAINASFIAKYLQDFGHELLILAPNDMGRINKLKHKSKFLNTIDLRIKYSNPLIKYPFSFIFSHYENLIKFRFKEFDKFKPDIIMSQYHPHHYASVAGSLLSKRMKIPHIIRSHDIFNTRFYDFPYNIYHYFTYPPIFNSIKNSRIFYVNTSEMKSFIESYKQFKNVEFKIHHNGIDLSQFSPHYNNEELKEKYGANVILIAVGGIQEDYGIHNFIRAFPDVLKSYKDTQLLIIGDGPLLKLCRSIPLNEVSFNIEINNNKA